MNIQLFQERSKMKQFRTFAALMVLVGSMAQAFPSMIRHGYTSCNTCHADPSGAGLLTAYGRAQSDLTVRFRPDVTPEKPPEEAKPSAGFLWGAVELPEWLLISGNVRGGGLVSLGNTVAFRPLLMASDVRAQATIAEKVIVNASLGFSVRGAEQAALTPSATNTLVSREHWVGVPFADGSFLLRAGRITLPFGLRNAEHTSWVRSATRTDFNTGQSHGVSLAFNTDKIRGEVMANLGNYQVKPDIYRERGYSAFAEYLVKEDLALGINSLITSVDRDLVLRRTLLRQAHGAFMRWTPKKSLVLLAEVDALILNPARLVGNEEFKNSYGYVAWAQADFEPIQGIHALLSGEILDERRTTNGPSLGGWATFLFLFAPHAEFRFDAIYRNQPGSSGERLGALTLLAQLHFFL